MLKITLSQPEYTSKVFAAVNEWLHTYIMANLPADVSATYTWSNDETITVAVEITWTKPQFIEADFDAMHAWMDTNVMANLPSYAHASYRWVVTS